jgi:hypothetical protein
MGLEMGPRKGAQKEVQKEDFKISKRRVRPAAASHVRRERGDRGTRKGISTAGAWGCACRKSGSRTHTEGIAQATDGWALGR